MKRIIGALALAVALSVSLSVQAAVTQIIRYDAGVSGNTTPVLDQSGAGNNGVVDGLDGVGLSTDVPDVAPAGAMSYDFSPGPPDLLLDSRIATTNIDLLENSLVAAAGGFSMETWFKVDLPFALPVDLLRYNPNLISYTGTERIAIVNTDNATPGRVTVDGTLQFTTSNGGFAVASDINDVNVIDGAWHKVLAEFVVTDDTDLTNLIGVLRMTIDDTFVYTAPGNKNTVGDDIDRPTSFGFHPTGTNPRDDFDGLLYNPTVSMGVADSADFDFDADVDGADFLAWQHGVGITGTAQPGDGDANSDNNVNAADLAIFQQQFGTGGSASPSVAAVPEPSAVCLFILGTVLVRAARKR